MKLSERILAGELWDADSALVREVEALENRYERASNDAMEARYASDQWHGRYTAALGEWKAFSGRMYQLLNRFLAPSTRHAGTCLANDRGRAEECNCHIADARRILEGAAALGEFDPEIP